MFNYRQIESKDNKVIANIIRKNLEKYHLDIPGTAYYDPQLDSLSDYYYDSKDRIYFVALNELNQVVGGIGIDQFEGIPDCAEIQKLYLDDSIKGQGYGKSLMTIATNWAKEVGYKQLYLETHHHLKEAIGLYEKFDFNLISKPKSVVHGTMDRFYLKQI